MGKISYVFSCIKEMSGKFVQIKEVTDRNLIFLCVLSGEVQIGACTGKQRCL